MMKKMELVIAPFKLVELCFSLEELGAKDIILSEIIDLQKQKEEIFRGIPKKSDFVKKIKLELHMDYKMIEEYMEIIRQTAVFN